jgi:hypothetical protein
VITWEAIRWLHLLAALGLLLATGAALAIVWLGVALAH